MMNVNKPRVSIGLPVYNGQRYLKETLDSILAQTFTDLELIICDNCSTDQTQQICEEYASADPRVRYHRNARNLGIAPNYNKCFELSVGEYFKWADYDDVIAPTFVEQCVAVLDANPLVSICFSRVQIIDENSAVLRHYDPLPDTSSPDPHRRFVNLILSTDHMLSQISGLIRADFLKKSIMHGSYPCSDEVLLAHLALLGPLRGLPEHLIAIRTHGSQSTKGVLASERARVLLFDTSLANRIVLIKWLYFRDCVRAAVSSPLTLRQRVLCYLGLVRWLAVPRNFRSLAKDFLLAINERLPLSPRLSQETRDVANRPHHYQ
jgi:glycosyltransferase involved in cell wall biosynthesis